jgi:hypothetical protein
MVLTMKIKMYTKVTCFTSEGMSHETIECVPYDSIDNINMSGGGNANNLTTIEDAKISYNFQITTIVDEKIRHFRWVPRYADMMFDIMIARASRNLSLDNLHIMYMSDQHKEMILREVYGVHEKAWRYQRQLFEFVCRLECNAEKNALIQAANIVIEAMRDAGEDEETIRRYRKTFINPQMKRFRRS